ncbi:hypothetical protein EAF04_007066 [Stromatinia cepivora]|nr:hypothetical protein EAF04_007066 [Stromatinia cepivora]
MESEASATMIGLNIQHEGYVKQAMELISIILGQIQTELGKQSIKSPTQNAPDKKGKDDARERYKQLHSDYKIMSDQLNAFACEKAKAPWRRGQGQGELQVAQARARIEDLEAEVKALQAQASQPAQDLQMLYIEIEELGQENKALQSEIEELRQENKALQSKIESMEQRYEQTRSMLGLYRQKLSGRVAGTENGPAIARRFLDLTYQIQDLVEGHLNMAQKGRPKEGHQRRQRDVSLSKIWDENLNLVERRFRAMAAIFEFLNDEILLKPAFGLEDDDENGTLESGLVEFEKRLRDCPEESVEFRVSTEWTHLTLNNVERIRKRGTGTKLNAFALDLENFLEPLSKANDEKLRQEILELCTEAFNLSQFMRLEPRIEFRIYFAAPGSKLPELPKLRLPGVSRDVDRQPIFLEMIALERGYPEHLAETTAFTVFGGLSCIMEDFEEHNPVVVPAKVSICSD